MNLRILKKLSKRAAPILAAQFRYAVDDFSVADGSECVSAVGKMPKRLDSSVGLVYPLPGTPLNWYRTSYEYDEWDAQSLWELLYDTAMWTYVTFKSKDVMEPVFPKVRNPSDLFRLLTTTPPPEPDWMQ